MLVQCAFVFGVFQIIVAQNLPPGGPRIPKECMGPLPGVSRHPASCCDIPRMIDDDKLAACGVEKSRQDSQPPSCESLNCLFSNNGGPADETAFSTVLDEWATKNPDWANAVTAAKEFCFSKDLPGPPQACPMQRLTFCVNGLLWKNCINWDNSDDCKAIREHAEHCDKLIQNQN